MTPTPDRTALILERLATGESLASIARSLGVTRQRVSQLVKAAGKDARSVRKATLDAAIEKLLREEALPEYRIAKTLGCSSSRVKRVREDLGLPAREQRQDPEIAARNARIIELLLEGKTYQEVSNTFDLTIGHIFHIARGKVPRRKHRMPEDFLREAEGEPLDTAAFRRSLMKRMGMSPEEADEYIEALRKKSGPRIQFA